MGEHLIDKTPPVVTITQPLAITYTLCSTFTESTLTIGNRGGFSGRFGYFLALLHHWMALPGYQSRPFGPPWRFTPPFGWSGRYPNLANNSLPVPLHLPG